MVFASSHHPPSKAYRNLYRLNGGREYNFGPIFGFSYTSKRLEELFH